MSGLSVERQNEALRRVLPEWRVRGGDCAGIWEGPIQPLSRVYRVRLTYYGARFFDGFHLDVPPIAIHVLDPPIGALARAAGVKLPHVYPNRKDPDMPALCVYDPEAGEWTSSMLLVDTIVPWTSEWLFFYEGWEIDGRFGGVGRHPEPRSVSCRTMPTLESDAPSARAAFHSLGQREGGSASFPLMAAASAASSRPPYWPGWRRNTPAAVRSRLSSILSPERRLAA